MGDKTIIKVDSTHSPHGPLGQLYLATGVGVGMRLWRDLPPEPPKPEVARDYETVGYVISGRAELHSEGQMVLLEPGNAWVVPRHARHTYKILEPFTAVEATHPPAEIHDRDHPVGQGNRSTRNEIRGSGVDAGQPKTTAVAVEQHPTLAVPLHGVGDRRHSASRPTATSSSGPRSGLHHQPPQ